MTIAVPSFESERPTTIACGAKLKCEAPDFYYGQYHTLKSIDVSLERRQVTVFIGPSGCGKSTLLRILNRMYDLYPEQRDAGRVMLDRVDGLGPAVDVDLDLHSASNQPDAKLHHGAFWLSTLKRPSRRDQ